MSPRLVGIRERADRIIFDTNILEPGSRTRFFTKESKNAEDWLETNHFVQHWPPGGSLVFLALAIRLLDEPNEKQLLDRVLIDPIFGDKIHGPIPGIFARTDIDEDVIKSKLFRLGIVNQVVAAEALADEMRHKPLGGEDFDPRERAAQIIDQCRVAIIPGYTFARPPVVQYPSAENMPSVEERKPCFWVDVYSDLGTSVKARVFLLGLNTRDVV